MANATEPKRKFLKRESVLSWYKKTDSGDYVYTGTYTKSAQAEPLYRKISAQLLLFAGLAFLATLIPGFLPYASKAVFTFPGTQVSLRFSALVLLPWAIALLLELPLLYRAYVLFRKGPRFKTYIYEKTYPSLPGFAIGALFFLILSAAFFLIDALRGTSNLGPLQNTLMALAYALALLFLLLFKRRLSKLTFAQE